MTTDTRAPVDEDEIDEAAVLRAMDGDTTVALNSDEVLEVIDRLHDRGMTDRDIALRIGAAENTVCSWRLGRSRPLGLAANRSATKAPAPRPLASVPASTAAPTTDDLVTAAARSVSKRTQALGVKLHDLAGVLRQRLSDEREQAENAERDRAAREAAAAEVKRLEAALAEARVKAGLTKRTAAAPAKSRKPYTLSDEERQRRSDRMKARNAARRGESAS